MVKTTVAIMMTLLLLLVLGNLMLVEGSFMARTVKPAKRIDCTQPSLSLVRNRNGPQSSSSKGFFDNRVADSRRRGRQPKATILRATNFSDLLGQDAATNIAIFGAGLFPFLWATVEFWNRIAVGKPFGTGNDSVYIGKDNAPETSRGQRVLDKGAFVVAYALFAVAAGVVGISILSVTTNSGDFVPPFDK